MGSTCANLVEKVTRGRRRGPPNTFNDVNENRIINPDIFVMWHGSPHPVLAYTFYGNRFELGVPSERENVDKNVNRNIDGKMLWERS